jgi:hypothetical protein
VILGLRYQCKKEIKVIQKLSFKIEGIAPLMTHNGRLADVDDPYVRAIKAITSNRKKTDADLEELARLEFLGGLYLNKDERIIIPGYVFEAALIGKSGAARKEKMGKEAAAALWVTQDPLLIYDGPREPDELWKDKRFVNQSMVRIGTSKVKRTRPFFQDWGAEIVVEFNDNLINEDQVRRWVEVAGEQVGLCEWRPRLGRFHVIWDE